MQATIRRATAEDARTIRALVRAARINPTGLDWRRFLVASEGARIVGVVQLKPHRDGTRELASLAIVPERRGQGLGAELIGAIRRDHAPPLWITCRSGLVGYYARFGFREVARPELPAAFRAAELVANSLLGLLRAPQRMRVMVWEG